MQRGIALVVFHSDGRRQKGRCIVKNVAVRQILSPIFESLKIVVDKMRGSRNCLDPRLQADKLPSSWDFDRSIMVLHNYSGRLIHELLHSDYPKARLESQEALYTVDETDFIIHVYYT